MNEPISVLKIKFRAQAAIIKCIKLYFGMPNKLHGLTTLGNVPKSKG